MNNTKIIEEMLARIQVLEEKVEALSGISTKASKAADTDEKRCLPGFNSCGNGSTNTDNLIDANAAKKEGRCLPGFNSCGIQ